MKKDRNRSWRLDAAITPAQRLQAKTDVPRAVAIPTNDVDLLGARAARAIAFDNHPVRPFRINVIRYRAIKREEP